MNNKNKPIIFSLGKSVYINYLDGCIEYKDVIIDELEIEDLTSQFDEPKIGNEKFRRHFIDRLKCYRFKIHGKTNNITTYNKNLSVSDILSDVDNKELLQAMYKKYK